MAGQDDWVSTLRGIIQQMVVADISELEIRREKLRIRLRRDPAAAPDPADNGTAADSSAPGGSAYHRVAAPLTGIYYAAPNPNARPYVSVGDWLEHDSVVGLIETMKVFNEVAAECRGRVTSILAKQGQLVHANEALLLVDTAAAPDHEVEVAP